MGRMWSPKLLDEVVMINLRGVLDTASATAVATVSAGRCLPVL